MKLTELNPRWIGLARCSDTAIKMGISFDCPHCRRERLAVYFRNPIDPRSSLPGSTWEPGLGGKIEWERTGNTFDSLTLNPSIDASDRGHWHGHIIDGEALTA